tara:strand:+ start:213 stop:419 length:207 start_codon:yes stop_codon:yes gene_type:complete
MKRLDNNFDEWDREIDRLKGLGLDDQSRLYKNLYKETNHINEKAFVGILWGAMITLLFVIGILTIAFG